MTQEQAAEAAGLKGRWRWQEYEAGVRRPAAATWELWLLKTRMHPDYELIPRRQTPVRAERKAPAAEATGVNRA